MTAIMNVMDWHPQRMITLCRYWLVYLRREPQN